jgi:uncharacterized protein (DUF58 family)
VRLRSVLWACLAGLAGSAILRSPALAFATLAASAIAALVIATRRRLFRSVSFERSVSRRVVPWGGDVEVALSVTNDKLLPLVWLQIRDQWPSGAVAEGFGLRKILVLDRQELVQTVSVRWYERLRRRYRVRCEQRGVHRFGPAELQAGDPFGIAGVITRWEKYEDVVVLPRVLDVPAAGLLLGRPLVEEETARSLAVDPTALRGTRPYRPGDSVSAVNWRATARTGELHTNEYDPASLASVRVLLDVGSLYRAWEGVEPELMELLCVVAASLASSYADRGYAVGFASNAADAREVWVVDLEPATGALPEVLEAIARLRPFSLRDYGSVLRDELEDDASGAACVVVTARLRPAVRDILTLLREDRPTTVVFVGRPRDDEMPCVDLVVPLDLDWRAAGALAIHA